MRSWVGFIINYAEHRLQITGKWKERDGWWWWKCKECVKASGVISDAELERLWIEEKVEEPDGETIGVNSLHPIELATTGRVKHCYYGDYEGMC